MKIAKPAEPVNGKMNDAFHAPPLTVPPAFADRQSRRESLKMASPHFNFERKIRLLFRECGYPFGTLCPIVRRGMKDGASYTPALSSCRFKCPCFPRRQRHFYGNADRAYNTLHFASKVVCQGASPFGNPRQQNRRYAALSGSIPPFVVSSPFHGLRVVPCKLT